MIHQRRTWSSQDKTKRS